jgi:alkanesulfonate monooxygenase SsuD/methylene tetrahydromethanopterin reductase-like flavin-dependent oxidoreductase (luciferase family)
MKFGVLQFFSWPDRRIELRTVYDRAFQRIDMMDQTGYDAVWLAEHHFSSYSICPSVHMMGVHIASRTKNLRIGTAISLAAFYHPLRLAEEVALLDVLTEGRVNWGAGRGFDPKEFAMFGVDPKESAARFHEAVEIVQAAWLNERMTHHGEYWDFDDVEVLPKPHQQPHPPMWVAASSESAIDWAGEKGYNILMDPHSSGALIAEKIKRYRAVLESNQHVAEDRDIPVARLLAVGKTESEAKEIAHAGAQWMSGGYMKLSAKTGQGSANEVFGVKEGEDPVERYVRDVVIHGTPESVTDQIHQLRDEMGLNYLLCAPLSHSSFVSFTENVLPKFV